MNTCKHENFHAVVNVGRFTASESEENETETIIAFSADLKIHCTQCNTPFEFIGLPMGLVFTEATCSVNGQEARLPIKPKGQAMRMDLAGFKLRQVL